MDLSKINMSTIITLAIAISLAYTAIKIFSNIIVRVVSFIIGVFLIVLVMNKIGISIPMLGDAVSYAQQMFKEVMANLDNMLSAFKGM